MAHPEQDFGPVAALGPEHHHNADLRRKARARPAPSRPNRRGLCGKSTGFVAIAGPNRPIREDHRALFNAAAKAAARSGLQSGATCSTAPAISILTTPAFIIVPTGAGASAGSTLSGTKLGPSSTSRTNFPFLARPRHCERCRAISPCFAATSQTRAPGSRLSATIRSRSLSDRWRSIAHSHPPANAADRSAHPEPHPAKLPCDREPPSGAQFGAPQPSSRKHHLQASMTENPKGRNHGGGRTACFVHAGGRDGLPPWRSGLCAEARRHAVLRRRRAAWARSAGQAARTLSFRDLLPLGLKASVARDPGGPCECRRFCMRRK